MQKCQTNAAWNRKWTSGLRSLVQGICIGKSRERPKCTQNQESSKITRMVCPLDVVESAPTVRVPGVPINFDNFVWHNKIVSLYILLNYFNGVGPFWSGLIDRELLKMIYSRLICRIIWLPDVVNISNFLTLQLLWGSSNETLPNPDIWSSRPTDRSLMDRQYRWG